MQGKIIPYRFDTFSHLKELVRSEILCTSQYFICLKFSGFSLGSLPDLLQKREDIPLNLISSSKYQPYFSLKAVLTRPPAKNDAECNEILNHFARNIKRGRSFGQIR